MPTIAKKIKTEIHFKDMHQDCLRWDLDKDGYVQHCDKQTRIWKGSYVDPIELESLQPGDLLPFKNNAGEERVWKYPIKEIKTFK